MEPSSKVGGFFVYGRRNGNKNNGQWKTSRGNFVLLTFVIDSRIVSVTNANFRVSKHTYNYGKPVAEDVPQVGDFGEW